MGTYLVTGIAGFIASKVAELLLMQNHTVIGIDNINNAYDVRLKYWRLDQIKNHSNFTFHQLDICDRQGLCNLFKTQTASRGYNFDAVINLAARAGVRQSVEDPWLYFETNTTGTLNLLELCKTFQIPKFVLASTSSLYGKDNSMPWKEEQQTNHPLSPYAASKKAAEVLCHTYHYLYGIDVTVLRYFTVYGPAGRPDMSLFRFVHWIIEEQPVKIFGNGKQSRDFTYIDDIARGTIYALRSVGYEIINLGSDEPIMLIDAVHMIEKMVGTSTNLHYEPIQISDVPASWADINRAKHLLGWQPNFKFANGLKALVEWYIANREWAKTLRQLE